MTRLRFVVLAIAGAAVVSCAAVAGLGDFELVDCPTGCDGGDATTTTLADGATVITLPDGNIVPIDASSPDGGGSVDAGPTDLDGAIAVVPDCRITTCPSTLGDHCSLESCTNAPVWTVTQDAGGAPPGMGFQVVSGRCHPLARENGEAFVSNTLNGVGGDRFELDLHAYFQNMRTSPSSSATTIMQVRFGKMVALRIEYTNGALEVCNVSACIPVNNSSFDQSSVVEVYATAGAHVSQGTAVVAVGEADQTCTPQATIALPGPLVGDPSVDVGCVDSNDNCDFELDDAVFSVRQF